MSEENEMRAIDCPSEWRTNTEDRFMSERADNATQKYGVTSISLLAVRS